MREPAEQVWPAFWTIALMITGMAASRSASANTIAGICAEFERDAGVMFGRGLLDQRAHLRGAGEGDEGDARMARQRIAGHGPETGDDVERAGRQPASIRMFASASEDRQASSAGLSTQALPAASAPPTERRTSVRDSSRG